MTHAAARAMLAFCLLTVAFPWPSLGQTPPGPASTELIVELRIHGNQIATNAEIEALSGVTVGEPVTATTFADITRRLLDSKKFDQVEVLKRFASVSDPTRVVILIMVNEGPLRLEVPKEGGGQVQIVKRGFRDNLMWIPIVFGEDGYSLTVGARLALVNLAGPRNRVSFPLTLGGTKQAAVEFDRTFANGPLTRIKAGTGIVSRANPAFEIDDTRLAAGVRVERAFRRLLVGGFGGWQRVSFDTDRDDISTFRGDVAFDTRIDPAFPRNAVYLRASVEHLVFAAPPSQAGVSSPINRTRLEGQAYLGFIGQTVIMVRALREDADGLQPRYLQSILGGWTTLRGFRAGAFTGDTLVTGSLELRVPFTSPQAFMKWGVNGFVDYGTVYTADQSFSDATFHTGAGGGVWFTAPRVRFSLALAHGMGGNGNHINFDAGINF